MKKYINIFIVLIALSKISIAQVSNKSEERLLEASKNSDLIIKGQIIKTYCFTAKGGASGYNTAFIIKIEKVLKGNYNADFIETYNEGGTIGNVKIESPHMINEIECHTGSGYFCLIKNNIEKVLTPDTVSNLPIYQPLAAICMWYEINKETKKRDLWSGHYKEIYLNSEEQIYQALNLSYNLPKELKKKEKSVQEKQSENQIKSLKFYENQKQFYSKRDNFNNAKAAAQSDPQGCKEPFFSEFLNGSNLNKALEIFNPRTTALNLSGFVIKAGIIGQSTLISVTLDGTIQPKGTYVISNVSADTSILQVANKIINDSTLLNTVQITLEDSTGSVYDKIGSRQLSEWVNISLPFYSTHSFKRDYYTSKGDTNWVSAQTTWNAIPQNDFSNIHRHVNICSPQANEINFEFDNFITSNSGGADFVEFDIMATSSVNTYRLIYLFNTI